MSSLMSRSMVVLVIAAIGGCGTPDAASVTDGGPDFGSTIVLAAPVILDNAAGPCTEAQTLCMTVQMPDTIPGAPTHLAIGYYKVVPVGTPAAARGVLQTPPLVAGQTFRLKVQTGSLTGLYYPVVLVYMPGGGDIIAVDNLDYTAEATQMYDLSTTPLNLTETMKLVYGL